MKQTQKYLVLFALTLWLLPGATQVVQAQQGNFAINGDISDAWYDPDTSGQGFFIIVWEDIETIFLSWFTYDVERPAANVTARLGEPGHRWLTAQGPYSGNKATLTAWLTAGGVFNASQPPPAASQQIGTVTITWTSCNAGLLKYEFTGGRSLSGEIPIQRVLLDNVPSCENRAGP